MRLKAETSDLLATLVAEQKAETEGNRNAELFRRTRVALEHGYDPDVVSGAMAAAGIAGGLDRREVAATIASALDQPIERATDGTPSVPPERWLDVWNDTWPRVIGIGPDKVPRQPWQYGWDRPNEDTRPGTYLAIVIPPGLAVLDVDDADAFLATGLEVPDGAPQYPSISGKPGKGHVWFRLHPDRPYPTRKMKAWPGADRLIGGLGVANVRDWDVVAALPPPTEMPLAPDWFQPPRDPGKGIRNIIDYLGDVPLHIPWVIDKVAYVHGLTIVAGAPKAGKSTLSFEMMRCRETGEPFLDQYVQPGPTLLVTEEGGVSIRFKGGELADLDVYDRKASAGETFEETLAVIAEWCAAHPGGLVFIDTLAAWAQVEDENDSAEMQAAIDGIRLAISEPYEVAVVLIHHARKGGGRDGEGIRGSGAILAAVDHVIELTRASEREMTQRYVSVISRVLPTQEKWLCDWDAERRRYTKLDVDEAASLTLEEEVARIPASGPGITERDTGLSYRRLQSLINKGRVRRQDGSGTRPHLYWGIPPAGLPFRGDDDDE